MGLSEKDKLDYKKGMLEIVETLGTTDILYRALDTSVKDSIYAEKKRVQYLDPIKLSGNVIFNINDTSSFQDIQKPNFSMAVTIPVLEFERKNLNPEDLVTGVFIIEGKTYNILSCNPLELFAGFYSSYGYDCKGVDSL